MSTFTASSSSSSSSPSSSSDSSSLTPVLYLAHGGGPSFYMRREPGSPFTFLDSESEAAAWLRSLASSIGLSGPNKPKAMLVISAHWETDRKIHVSGRKENPNLYYDYYGFPDYTYEIQYPAPGDPELAKRVVESLKKGGIDAQLDMEHNFDHGVFVPLGLVYPKADVPIVEVSLSSSLDPALHVSIGRRLQEFRKEGVLIVGSGFLTHNLRGTGKGAKQFVGEINRIVTSEGRLTAEEREKQLEGWDKLPYARSQHPREEHLIPLHVCVGASGSTEAEVINNMWFGSPRLGDTTLTSYIWRN